MWLHSPTTVRPHFCQRFLRIFRGFGKLPNKQNPRQALHEWQGFYGSGYPLPMLAIQVLCSLKWLLCNSHIYRPCRLKVPFRRRFCPFSESTVFICCLAGFKKCCGNLRGKGGFSFLKEAVIFPHGKAALFVGTVVVFLPLIYRGFTAGTLPKLCFFCLEKLLFLA